MPKVAITEAGMATPAMSVERQLRMKASTTRRGQDAAQHEVHVDLVQRGVDVARLVADDLELARRRGSWAWTRRQVGLDASITATVFAPDWRRTSRVTVGTPFRRASERCSLVPSSARPMSRTRIGDAVDGGDHQLVEARGRRRCGPSCAARSSRRRAVTLPPGHVGVLAHDGVAHGGDRDLVGGEPVGVDPDVDRALRGRRRSAPRRRRRSARAAP